MKNAAWNRGGAQPIELQERVQFPRGDVQPEP